MHSNHLRWDYKKEVIDEKTKLDARNESKRSERFSDQNPRTSNTLLALSLEVVQEHRLARKKTLYAVSPRNKTKVLTEREGKKKEKSNYVQFC